MKQRGGRKCGCVVVKCCDDNHVLEMAGSCGQRQRERQSKRKKERESEPHLGPPTPHPIPPSQEAGASFLERTVRPCSSGEAWREASCSCSLCQSAYQSCCSGQPGQSVHRLPHSASGHAGVRGGGTKPDAFKTRFRDPELSNDSDQS